MQAQLQLIQARVIRQLQLFRAENAADFKHGRFQMQVVTASHPDESGRNLCEHPVISCRFHAVR
ncbi:hypothetical protein [Burkholderia humptydooensis]|uniref:hypothetical protein n=1 Tax=Burkholderia humptydooensis TaxID=430531 RepID=UPI000ADD385B|nr:hypothetical protein [Burkholderia humptydooensis]